MSTRWVIIISFATALTVVTLWPTRPVMDHRHWRIGDEEFHILHADSAIERQRGLGGRTELSPDTVMLFSFPLDGLHGIWMKDMRFAIDIVWLDSERRVIHIEERVSPDTFPQTFRPDTPARYVVEMNAGTVKALGIEKGQQLEAWPSG